MTRRLELTDDQWALISTIFPAQGRGGRWSDHRTAIDGMMWRLRTGDPWRDLPERYGPWETIYHRFNASRKSGLIDGMLELLQARLNTDGLIDAGLFCVDGTVIRASRAAAGAMSIVKKSRRRAGRPRPGPVARRLRHEGPPGLRRQWHPPGGGPDGGPAAGVHAVRGGHGRGPAAGPPRSAEVPAGEAGRRQGPQLSADPAMAGPARDRGGDPAALGPAPGRQAGPFRRGAYKRRSVVERCMGWLKECRAMATRFDELAEN